MSHPERCWCCGKPPGRAVRIFEPERLVPKALCIPCFGHIRADRDGCLMLPDPYPHGLRLVRDDE